MRNDVRDASLQRFQLDELFAYDGEMRRRQIARIRARVRAILRQRDAARATRNGRRV